MKVRIYDRLIIAIFIFSIYDTDIQAQVFSTIKNCVVDASGECIPNPIITGVPYLRMNIEHYLKGNNTFYSTGLGLKYNNATLNVAHTFPSLNNYAFYRRQLFLTMLYDFGE